MTPLIIAIIITTLIYALVIAPRKPGLALISSLGVAVAFILAAVSRRDEFASLLAPIIFMVTLFAMLITCPEDNRRQWPYVLARWTLITIAAFLLVVALAMLLDFTPIVAILLALLPLFIVIAIVAAVQNVFDRPRTIAHNIVATLYTATQQNLPLATALRMAATGRNDPSSDIFRHISNWLGSGFSLSESIQRGYPKCPGHILAMIAMAQRVDQVPLALKCLQDDLARQAQERRRFKPIQPAYPLLVITVTYMVTLGLITFVVPKFKDIFADFGCKIPPITIALVDFARLTYGWLGLLLVAAIFILGPLSVWLKLRPRKPDDPALLSRMADTLKWRLPLLHWFEKNYSLTRTIELLRLSINAGAPLDHAIANACQLDVNHCFRKRLDHWRRAVNAGQDPALAALHAHLGRPLAWAFDQRVNPANTPAVLEVLERFYRSNYNYLLHLARTFLWPLVILTLAAFVGLVCYAMFVPLVELINQTALTAIP